MAQFPESMSREAFVVAVEHVIRERAAGKRTRSAWWLDKKLTEVLCRVAQAFVRKLTALILFVSPH
jgi:hypothetical protein